MSKDSEPPQEIGIPSSKKDRIDRLKKIFVAKYGVEPEVYFRIPGRVNLIGEHVDYCGYSVCPMALEQDLLMAVKTTEDVTPILEATNILCDKFPDCCVTDEDFMKVDKICQEKYGWCAYLLCGVRGGIEKMKKSCVSMKIAVDCTIPPSAGLSSSSALVSGAMLATTYLNEVRLSKLELAKLSAECEHYIGTAGGGMDQAIAFCATKGAAKHIEFNPLRTTDVKLPKDAVFVVAHSLVTKEKAQSCEYNSRVVETRLAANILANDQDLNWKEMLRLADVQKALGVSIDKMIGLVKSTLHCSPYSKQEILSELCIKERDLNDKILTHDTINMCEFHLYDRALHVVSEAKRVSDFLTAGCSKALGKLMSESHESLRSLFEASHPKLDELVNDCLDAGALGARLTGAGWGGCVVAITTCDKVDSFLDNLKKSFYKRYYKGSNIDEVLFATTPAGGAQIYKPAKNKC